MSEVIPIAMFAVSSLINISSLDDAFIDLMAFGISRRGLPSLSGKSAIPRIAVFVANWHEEDVLGRMVEGNLARITCPDVSLYLGVYPNDTGTLRVARELECKYPSRVTVIVNTLSGPTSKGQMLNEMFRQVFEREDCPDIAVLHDSEDVIDPRTFSIYAEYSKDHDFIQVPVFSLDRGEGLPVASTYMDEFAERHTREMIVRNAVGAAIPSAGVGTAMTRKLLQHFLATRGQVLMSGTVTEDYILGVEAKRAGFRSAFAAVSADDERGLNYVATREFFPKSLSASIKQKTRWVYGINFEATHKLGWKGDAWDKYFFVRDRKGVVTNLLPPVSLMILLLIAGGIIDLSGVPESLEPFLSASVTVNLVALFTRYVVRVAACREVYGTYDLLGIAYRWPVGLYINAAAVFRAWKTYIGESEFATKPIGWSKTAHDLPEDFGKATR
ncbi:general secretory system II protein E domain protein [Methylobacterium sp. 4-46]|uniref:glycosyl transferase family protein n=1 Tax=unclassified Methylobacterium TaxID=2615210 RepID=UPI000152D51A|nr:MULTISPECIES: glycosyl transferase family protein [Methylobacterium]ACA17716.1 general secretory system II protein E domain protein [Methylobacterium sp. 4-46]WFT83386.1 glycosyl transferase family protein [Methylobacterium nodulans]